MDRKLIARDTLQYMQQGYYSLNGEQVDIADKQKYAEDQSVLVTPERAEAAVRSIRVDMVGPLAECSVVNVATVKAILNLVESGKEHVGVLNFASAKNPGGGFLNGAMAQEESLAASSGLYGTQLRHERFYKANRACGSMMYTHHAIYSPDVVFFRDEKFILLPKPITASVLTLPAVNYGQVVLKGEDTELALRVMKERMRIALALFAKNGDKNLILGAYGCGVFRNDPVKVAGWWKALLVEEGYGSLFEHITFAVLDGSKNGFCIKAFEDAFGRAK
ncbi:TIGR02452 family protein [Cohnella sp. GCM10012308]|uniref:TIGR02452 family protein n=1 Tax=Cohnella sp. GCM10012308 TaxID=3317329 RepID=UPI00360AAC5B